ncbi:hypothetical protein, partial [Ohtaekwangia sp.]|uniref:hypothetical protein n=1 Tax=Ohtaekwangia sp. TaxID=2066019 RepID=UPI002FDEF470
PSEGKSKWSVVQIRVPVFIFLLSTRKLKVFVLPYAIDNEAFFDRCNTYIQKTADGCNDRLSIFFRLFILLLKRLMRYRFEANYLTELANTGWQPVL